MLDFLVHNCWLLITIAVVCLVAYIILTPKLMLKILARIIRGALFPFHFSCHGLENLPYSGPTLLVSNHVSILDLIMIQSVARQRVRFLIRSEVARYWVCSLLFRYLNVLVVPDVHQTHEVKKFLETIKNNLKNGETICFFPEGAISGSGNLMRFRSGVKSMIPEGIQVNVIPMRLGMIHGRLVGYDEKKKKIRFRGLITWPVNYSIIIGKPVDFNLSAFQLRQEISELGAVSEAKIQPGEEPFHTKFIYRAKRHPFATTFHDGVTGDRINNFNLLVRTILISREIRRLDQGKAGYTGVLLPNAPITAGVVLSVLCADRTPAIINFSAGAAVALDSARRAGIEVIITSRKFLQKLKWEETPEMICLEDVVPKITAGKFVVALLMSLLPARSLVRNLAPLSCHDMYHQAVLLFSSGSTGKPKAVMLTQHNISCDIMSFIRVMDLHREDRICGNLPLFHAYGFTVELAFPCYSGKPAVYIANPLDAGAIVKAIREYKLTILTATPTFMQMYMKKATREDFLSLRMVITGAEKLRQEQADRYRELTGRDIIEGYGCTELSPIVTVNLNNSIYTLGTKADHPGSIGCPLPGIHIRIIDSETGVELPPNTEGRLMVRAGTVMKGYLNEPELTARVLQHEYYDTGDIGKMDEDGYIYVTGRASRFSKIGGEMVPHEGLEEAIGKVRHSENREVAVTGRGDKRKGERLVVFYIGEDFDPATVVEGLREQGLPNIWIPKAEDFFKVESLPVLGSGKLDLVKLKDMVQALPE